MTGRQTLIRSIADFLKQNKQQLTGKKITAGFDGFIDTVARIIKEKSDTALTTVSSAKEFATYIADKSGTNFSLELQEIITKPGGNMPIMANALGKAGVQVNCIGALGLPSIHAQFEQLSSNCTLYSFANPGITTAIEFDDSKMLLAEMTSINNSGWETVKNTVGINKLVLLFNNADGIAFLNWSEIDHATEIWKGIIDEVLTDFTNEKNKPFIFIDLADCSKRTASKIIEVLELIKTVSKKYEVVLGLNANETKLIADILLAEKNIADLEKAGEQLCHSLQVQSLLVHHAKEAYLFDQEGIYRQEGFSIKEPKIFTGAGDNFNAGFCLGKLLKLSSDQSLLLAHAVAGYYIANAQSATIEALVHFLETNSN